jgi:cytochrome c551/c552
MQTKILCWQWVLSICVITVMLAACGQPRVEASIPDRAAAVDTAGGAELFQQKGCVACHQMNGKGPGPSLAGLYGTTITLESGEEVRVDEQYIRNSILAPQSQIHAGYPPIMPAYAGRISDDELSALVTHIRTLQE